MIEHRFDPVRSSIAFHEKPGELEPIVRACAVRLLEQLLTMRTKQFFLVGVGITKLWLACRFGASFGTNQDDADNLRAEPIKVTHDFSSA